eukprot:6919988-Prymnesium_polylepis.1
MGLGERDAASVRVTGMIRPRVWLRRAACKPTRMAASAARARSPHSSWLTSRCTPAGSDDPAGCAAGGRERPLGVSATRSCWG